MYCFVLLFIFITSCESYFEEKYKWVLCWVNFYSCGKNTSSSEIWLLAPQKMFLSRYTNEIRPLSLIKGKFKYAIKSPVKF